MSASSTNSVVDSLIEWLSANANEQRLVACRSLASLGTVANRALPTLVNLLKDTDSEIRLAALEAIRQIGLDADSAIPVLLDLHDAAMESAEQGDGEYPHHLVCTLYALNLDRAKIETFLPVWTTDDRAVRISAIWVMKIADVSTEVQEKYLVDLLAYDDEVVISSALDALISLGPDSISKAESVLCRLVQDHSGYSDYIAQGLGHIPTQASIVALHRLLEDPGCVNAAEALLKVGGREDFKAAETALLGTLADPDYAYRHDDATQLLTLAREQLS